MDVFATSRFSPEIEEWFEGSLRLEIRAKEEDIRAFLRKNQKLQEEIKAQITEVFEGIYVSSFSFSQIYTNPR